LEIFFPFYWLLKDTGELQANKGCEFEKSFFYFFQFLFSQREDPALESEYFRF